MNLPVNEFLPSYDGRTFKFSNLNVTDRVWNCVKAAGIIDSLPKANDLFFLRVLRSVGRHLDNRQCDSYLSDVGGTRMRVKTGRGIKLSCIGSLISHTSVRVREPHDHRPYIRSFSTNGSDSNGIKCFAYSCVALVVSMVSIVGLRRNYISLDGSK